MKMIYAQDDIELATIKQRILHGRARISTFFCGVLKNIPRVSLSTRLMLQPIKSQSLANRRYGKYAHDFQSKLTA